MIVGDYNLCEILGSGQFGSVYRAISQTDYKQYAVKQIPQRKFSQVAKLGSFTANEIEALGKIKNDNIVKFYKTFKTSDATYLVYEHCDGGTLEDRISRKGFMLESETWEIFYQLLNAFKTLHEENILHRDLKPSNILFHQGKLKVADFGFCKQLNSPFDMTLSMVGSPIYMAPEVLKGSPYNSKCDIWSLGVLIYETLFGICPYEDTNIPSLLNKIAFSPLQMPRQRNPISTKMEELLRKMLVADPAHRITWKQLLEYEKPSNALAEKETNRPTKTIFSSFLHQQPLKMAPLSSKQTEPETVKFEKLPIKPSENDPRVDYARVLPVLLKERDQISFLTNLAIEILEKEVSVQGSVCAYLIVKKALMRANNLKKEVALENASSKFKDLAEWKYFQNTSDYATLCRFVNQEIGDLREIYKSLQSNISQKIIKNIKADQDSNLIEELLKEGKMNEVYFKKVLLGYVNDLKTEGLRLIEGKKNESMGVQLIRIARNLVDVISPPQENVEPKKSYKFQNLITVK